MSKDKKDIIVYFIAKVIVGILGLITVTLYSELLNPTEYGEYSLISGLVSALIAIFIGWIGSSALRYYIDYQSDNEQRKVFYSNVIMYTCIMIFIILCIICTLGYISNTIPINKYLIATLIFTISMSLMEIFEKIFRASQRNYIYAINMILQTILNIAIFYVLVNYNIGANSILLSSAISRLIFIIIAILALHVLRYLKLFSFDKKLLKKFLKFGIPMIGVWGVSWVLNYCDRYIIALFYDNYDVGIYDMSYKIAENSINVIINSFTLAVYPILIKIWKNEGKEKLELKTKEIVKYYLLLVFPAVVGMACISNKIFLGILDEQYYSGRYIIIVVCIGMLFNGFNAILNKIWQLKEKTKIIFYIMAISVIANILLNIIFIPKFGIISAAVTTLASYLISNIITYILIKKEFNLIIDYKSFLKTIVSTIIMGIFLIWFNKYVNSLTLLLLEIILAIIIYGISSIILGNVQLGEVLKLRYGK